MKKTKTKGELSYPVPNPIGTTRIKEVNLTLNGKSGKMELVLQNQTVNQLGLVIDELMRMLV